MTRVYSQALDESFRINRIINELHGKDPGPTVVFTAGVHGNEPSGVFALRRILSMLEERAIPIHGHVYALAGNLPALETGERYEKQDLNRLWTAKRVKAIDDGSFVPHDKDELQQVELYHALRHIIDKHDGPFYFLDLHTTSSKTIPFTVVNDMMLNRRFTAHYPLPTILGVEEYLEGPLLSYINELGYVAFGFEGGPHEALESIENHEAFIVLTLCFAGVLDKNDIDYQRYYQRLDHRASGMHDFFEILYRYRISEGEKFKMEPGYDNFQPVRKGEKLAMSNGEPLLAKRHARVFMPLYQSQGSEGFFAIRKIPRRFLRWSTQVRKWRLDRLLPLLPGVHWQNSQREVLMVDRRVARFFTKQFFHLLGYRSKKLDRHRYLMHNREAVSRESEYPPHLRQ